MFQNKVHKAIKTSSRYGVAGIAGTAELVRAKSTLYMNEKLDF